MEIPFLTYLYQCKRKNNLASGHGKFIKVPLHIRRYCLQKKTNTIKGYHLTCVFRIDLEVVYRSSHFPLSKLDLSGSLTLFVASSFCAI